MIALECFAISDSGGSLDANEDSVVADPKGGIFVVADGMGGRPGGAQASSAATEAVSRYLRALEPAARVESVSLRDAIAAANQAVRSIAKADPNMDGLGTTLAATVLQGLNAGVVHVGDSRVYLFRDGGLNQLTEDHTLVAELVARHDLSRERAQRFPLRNVLSRSIGTQENVDADVYFFQVRADDWLLLATDGLAGAMDLAHLQGIMVREQEKAPQQMCEAIVHSALQNEPQDNLTVIAVRVGTGSGDS